MLLSDINKLCFDILESTLHQSPLEITFFPINEIYNFSSFYFAYVFNERIDFILNLSLLGITENDLFSAFPSETLSRSLEKSRADSELEFNLIHSMTEDQLANYSNIDSILAGYTNTVPLKKLQYPEPFIASASFIHTDIGFIHVLQYNY